MAEAAGHMKSDRGLPLARGPDFGHAWHRGMGMDVTSVYSTRNLAHSKHLNAPFFCKTHTHTHTHALSRSLSITVPCISLTPPASCQLLPLSTRPEGLD